MAVTFDNAGGTYTAGVALSFTFTASANTTMVAFVGTIDAIAPGASQSAVLTYAGVGLTRMGIVQGVGTGNNVPMQVWALTAPAAGANSFSATFAANANWEIMVATYSGVRAASGFGTVAAATGTSITELKLSLSSTSTDMVVFCFQATGAAGITMTGSTQRFTTSGTGAPAVWAVGDKAGAAPVTASASFSVANAPFSIGIPLVASAAATAALRAMLGVGL